MVAVDAHAHLHPCFSVDRFLDRAAASLSSRVDPRGEGGGDATGRGVLFLMEAAGGPTFREMLDRIGAESAHWTVEDVGEEVSAVCVRASGEELTLIRGQQVTSRERLEVLTVGSDASLPHGASFERSLDLAAGSGGVAIVPWGFGKWTGKRGRLVEKVIRGAEGRTVFVGDNGGRLSWSKRPRLLDEAARRGIPNLPGSDPLPFRSQVEAVARAGFLLEGGLERGCPASDVRRSLRTLRRQPETFADGEGLVAFVTSQIAIQLRSRIRGRS